MPKEDQKEPQSAAEARQALSADWVPARAALAHMTDFRGRAYPDHPDRSAADLLLQLDDGRQAFLSLTVGQIRDLVAAIETAQRATFRPS